MDRFRGKRPYPNLSDRDVVIVDDGIATGNTNSCSYRVCKKEEAGKHHARGWSSPTECDKQTF